MSDLSYTNKDGLNPAAGFINVFNYHKDGASSAHGYEHGGYPEITGETSDLPGMNYKTGDATDHWGNGNTFDIITGGGGGGNILTATGVYKRGSGAGFKKSEITNSYDLKFAISPESESDYVTYENQSFYEWKEGKYILGNTNILVGWTDYDGPTMHTDRDFCILVGFDVPNDDTKFTVHTMISPEIYDETKKYYLNWGKHILANDSCPYGYIYSKGYDWLSSDVVGSKVTDEQLDILKTYNEKEINVVVNGVKLVGTVEYEEGEEEGGAWLGISFEDYSINIYRYFDFGEEEDDKNYYFNALINNPYGIPENTALTASIDFDDLEPTA